MIKIAVDCMGGDFSPKSQVQGVIKFFKIHKNTDIHAFLYGNQLEIKKFLIRTSHTILDKITLVHCPDHVNGNDSPRNMRSMKATSMYRALNDLKDGLYDAVISFGNTAVLTTMSTIIIGRARGIKRSAMSCLLPSGRNKKAIMLDVGANLKCDANDYYNFAIMGSSLYRALNTIMSNSLLQSTNKSTANPKCGILNIGSEDNKGSEDKRIAHMHMAKIKSIEYIGYIEPDKILNGELDVDIVVSDGVSGNIAIKSFSGTVKFIKELISSTISSINIFSRYLIMLLSLPSLLTLKKTIDPRQFNGAPFLGLKKLVIKGHGSSDKISVYHTMLLASKLAKYKITDKINSEILNYYNITQECETKQ